MPGRRDAKAIRNVSTKSRETVEKCLRGRQNCKAMRSSDDGRRRVWRMPIPILLDFVRRRPEPGIRSSGIHFPRLSTPRATTAMAATAEGPGPPRAAQGPAGARCLVATRLVVDTLGPLSYEACPRPAKDSRPARVRPTTSTRCGDEWTTRPTAAACTCCAARDASGCQWLPVARSLDRYRGHRVLVAVVTVQRVDPARPGLARTRKLKQARARPLP